MFIFIENVIPSDTTIIEVSNCENTLILKWQSTTSRPFSTDDIFLLVIKDIIKAITGYMERDFSDKIEVNTYSKL